MQMSAATMHGRNETCSDPSALKAMLTPRPRVTRIRKRPCVCMMKKLVVPSKSEGIAKISVRMRAACSDDLSELKRGHAH